MNKVFASLIIFNFCVSNSTLTMTKKAKVIKSTSGVRKFKKPQKSVIVASTSLENEDLLVHQIEQGSNFITVEKTLDSSQYGFDVKELREALLATIELIEVSKNS